MIITTSALVGFLLCFLFFAFVAIILAVSGMVQNDRYEELRKERDRIIEENYELKTRFSKVSLHNFYLQEKVKGDFAVDCKEEKR